MRLMCPGPEIPPCQQRGAEGRTYIGSGKRRGHFSVQHSRHASREKQRPGAFVYVTQVNTTRTTFHRLVSFLKVLPVCGGNTVRWFPTSNQTTAARKNRAVCSFLLSSTPGSGNRFLNFKIGTTAGPVNGNQEQTCLWWLMCKVLIWSFTVWVLRTNTVCL